MWGHEPIGLLIFFMLFLSKFNRKAIFAFHLEKTVKKRAYMNPIIKLVKILTTSR